MARAFGVFLLALVPASVVGIALDAALGAFSGGFATSGIFGGIVSMALVGAGMAVIYFGALAVLRAPELNDLAAPVLRRLRRAR